MPTLGCNQTVIFWEITMDDSRERNGTTPRRGKGTTNGVLETRPGETLDSRALLHVLTEVRRGNFAVRLPAEQSGINGRVADAINDIIDLNERLTKELDKVSSQVGKEGKLS